MARIDAVTFRPASPADNAALRDLLAQVGLPVLEVGDERLSFVVAVGAGGRLVGCIGIEPHGAACLVRSLAVAPDRRRRGIGSDLFEQGLSLASARGVQVAYVVTKGGEPFLLERGFERVDRGSVPEELRDTSEFRTLPVNASCLRRRVQPA